MKFFPGLNKNQSLIFFVRVGNFRSLTSEESLCISEIAVVQELALLIQSCVIQWLVVSSLWAVFVIQVLLPGWGLMISFSGDSDEMNEC